jgi:hypothetical protein
VSNGGQRIVDFYDGSARDDRGRSLEDVLHFDDAALEYTHDFIQWLFPLHDPSSANPWAPRLDDAAVEAFNTRAELRAALRRALDRMLAFYGLQWRDRAIVPAVDFATHDGWLTPGNHNHLRLTRMLISLRTLGLIDEAQALFDCLCEIETAQRRTGRGAISPVTLEYWKNAMR